MNELSVLEKEDLLPVPSNTVREFLAQPLPVPLRKNVTRFKPLRDQVLVRRVAKEEKDESGMIWLPEKGKEKPMEGVVIAAGSGRFDLLGRFVPTEVKPEDRVLFGKYDGTEITLNGQPCLLLREEQIIGVIE